MPTCYMESQNQVTGCWLIYDLDQNYLTYFFPSFHPPHPTLFCHRCDQKCALGGGREGWGRRWGHRRRGSRSGKALQATIRTCEVRGLQPFHSLPALLASSPRPRTSPSRTHKVELDNFPTFKVIREPNPKYLHWQPFCRYWSYSQ